MRKIVVLLCLGAMLLVMTPGSLLGQAGYDLKIFPSKLELTGERGSTQQFVINIQNLGADNQNLKIYNNDYYIKPNNQFVFEKPGHESYSCAKWLTTDSQEVAVPPGKTVQKIFTLSVPANAEPGGHYGVMFFEQIPPPGGQPVKAVPRIGVVTLVTVPGQIVRKGTIKAVQVTSSWFWPTKKLPLLPVKKVHARVVFYNEGNVHLTIKGKLTYTPSFGWGTGSVDLEEITVLPKTTRYLEADIKNPPLVGTYEATAEVVYGPSLDVFDTTLTKKGTFHLYPFSLLLLLLLLLAVILVPLWLYRRSRNELVYPEEVEGGAELTEPGPAPAEAEDEPAAGAPAAATPEAPAQPADPTGGRADTDMPDIKSDGFDGAGPEDGQGPEGS